RARLRRIETGGGARRHRDEPGGDAGLRFRLALLRTARRCRRGPRHGIRPLRAHAVLERAPAAVRHDGVPGVAPRRRPPGAPGGRSGRAVAGAAALLYTAPVIVAVLARVLLKEALTVTRVLLALLVMAGVALTVTGGSNAGAEAARLGIGAGIAGGLVSALSYAGTTL